MSPNVMNHAGQQHALSRTFEFGGERYPGGTEIL
jgi:hypothetical protein